MAKKSPHNLINMFQTFDISPVEIVGYEIFEERDVVFLCEPIHVEIYEEDPFRINRQLRYRMSDFIYQYCEDNSVCRDFDEIKKYLNKIIGENLLK